MEKRPFLVDEQTMGRKTYDRNVERRLHWLVESKRQLCHLQSVGEPVLQRDAIARFRAEVARQTAYHLTDFNPHAMGR